MNTPRKAYDIGPSKAEAMRDLLRDFCRVSSILAEQEARFATTGTLSFALIDTVLGQDMRQGVLWRLKDNAHQYVRDSTTTGSDAPQAAALLDWCVGYVFHECIKLREDAFLSQHYTTSLAQMGAVPHTDCADICTQLMPVASQTVESTRYELARIIAVLAQAQVLCIRCLALHADNGFLARFLVEEAPLSRAVFGDRLEELYTALYGACHEARFVCAARACLEGGRPEQALLALDALDAVNTLPSKNADIITQAAELRRLAETFDPSHTVPDILLKESIAEDV